VAKELRETGTVRDPGRKKLVETRKTVVDSWMRTADILDRQDEITLAGDVRYFAQHLPPILTDRERIAAGILSRLVRSTESALARKVRVAENGGDAMGRNDAQR
jgi:hypothetical protein